MNRILILVMLVALLYAVYRHQQLMNTPPISKPKKKTIKKNNRIQYNKLPQNEESDVPLDGISQKSIDTLGTNESFKQDSMLNSRCSNLSNILNDN